MSLKFKMAKRIRNWIKWSKTEKESRQNILKKRVEIVICYRAPTNIPKSTPNLPVFLPKVDHCQSVMTLIAFEQDTLPKAGKYSLFRLIFKISVLLLTEFKTQLTELSLNKASIFSVSQELFWIFHATYNDNSGQNQSFWATFTFWTPKKTSAEL